MRIAIDAERCQGHGRCWETAPDLIDSDDVGRGDIRGDIRGDAAVPAGLEEQARMAVRACPERAVTLQD